METREELLERFHCRQERLSPAHLATEFGFHNDFNFHASSVCSKKTIPYSCEDTLRKVRNTGRWLYSQPTVRNCTDIMISFVIKNGHSYSFSPRMPATAERARRTQERVVQRMDVAVEVQRERLKWRNIQQESYLRLLRDGEYFRRFEGRGDSLDVWFIEPEFINQPRIQTLEQIVNREQVPEEVFGPWEHFRKVAGEFGVVKSPNDARVTLGYWEHLPKSGPRGLDEWSWIPASELQHNKDGVDDVDPRGIPRFYYSLKHNLAIEEVNGGMVDLTLIQAEHAAIYNFDVARSSPQNLLDIAKNRVRKQEEQNGRPNHPGVVHARAFQVELPGMSVDATDFIEIIQQEQRFTGGYSGIPEHMSTLDANTGNRSSLVAAEGPFDRRIQMEQMDQFESDSPIIWRMVPASQLPPEPMDYKLTPEFPLAASRDAAKEAATEINLVAAQLKSKSQAREKLRIDNEQANAEIMQETSQSTPFESSSDSSG